MTRILIVDDKEENLYYLQALLTGNGCVVESARHGAEALAKARQAPPDIAISDLLMPVMDGYTLLRHWKADLRLKQVPFIVYTATYTEPEDERLALNLGADAFILKPAEPDVFITRLREVQARTAALFPPASQASDGDENTLLKTYSETLIRKLEEKMLQLEESNRALRHDIADRKLAELKLKERDDLLLTAQAIAQMGSWVMDLVNNRLIWSETTCRLFGIAPGDFRETFEHFCEFILPEDRIHHNEEVSHSSPDKPHFEAEYRIRRTDGEVRWMCERGIVEYDQHGRQLRRLGMVLDITERKLADDELRWKTAFLEAQVDSSLDGILVVNNTGQKILQNQQMSVLWKIPPHIADNPDDAQQLAFVSSSTRDPQAFLSKINHLNTYPDEISRDEIELLDGTILDRFSSPVRDKSGKHYGRIWTFRDITDQRKLEAQFRQAQKMEAFGQLAGGVAHDFNNILAVIQMQAGLLQMIEPSLTLEQQDIASEIEKAAERGAKLTQQLLLFSRKQTMQTRDLKLNEVVENMAKMLRRTLGEQCNLQLELPPEPLYIPADSGMIDQILLNLTVNARDAMPKGGQIVIKIRAVDMDQSTAARNPRARPGAFICMQVADQGTGIPREVLPRIFEPFFTTKPVGKGTGLGLATVFGIVQQHKGWIDVSSELGKGTTFHVYLPRLSEKNDTEIIRRSTAALDGQGETILIVEDERSLRDSLRVALRRLGYSVIEAANADEALALWEENRDAIRLVLTDLVMPGMLDGRELGKELLRRNPRLKLIYVSGYNQEIPVGELTLEEGVSYLAKPFDSAKLRNIIRRNLDSVIPG